MNTQHIRRRTYSAQEFREMFGISNSFFYVLVSRGDIAILKLGRKTLIAAEEVDRWLLSITSNTK